MFARASGLVIGKVTGASEEELARAVWEQVIGPDWQRFAHLATRRESARRFTATSRGRANPQSRHVWRWRTIAPEVGNAARCRQYDSTTRRAGARLRAGESERMVGGLPPGAARTIVHPGGFVEIRLPPEVVSRAYLKMAEALIWSQLPIAPRRRSSRAWLRTGRKLPAPARVRSWSSQASTRRKWDASVLKNPNFTHSAQARCGRAAGANSAKRGG